MLILGLDPGSRHTGYGLVEQRGDRLRLVCLGRFSSPGGAQLPERLSLLGRRLGELVDQWDPAVAVLETPYLGMNPRTLVVLAQARGALIAALAARGVEVREYSPAEVKSAVTGNGRADKQQVARMVGLQLKEVPDNASADATDALAVALCYAHRHRMDRLTGARS